jgi:hypothetical protein
MRRLLNGIAAVMVDCPSRQIVFDRALRSTAAVENSLVGFHWHA